jgi:hypothetical protein
LGYVINNVSSFIIFTAIKYKFGFAGVAKIRIKIAKGVKCEDLFFLVNEAFKTLLKMPFIRKMKLYFSFNEDSSLDKKFTNLKDLASFYTIIIVLLLKSISGKRVHFR